MSQFSSEWLSAAPLSSPYLQSKRQNENSCQSYLEIGGFKEETDGKRSMNG